MLLAEGSRADHYTAGFDMLYSWDYYNALINVFNGQPAGSLYTTHSNEYAGVPSGKQRLRYSTNHDESAWNNTPMVLYNGKEGALAASVATIFSGGQPLFYTGQEVGRTDKVPFFSNSPISWNNNPDMLQAYKDMMNVYKSCDAAAKGSITNYSGNDVLCLKKSLNSKEALIIVNVRNDTTDFSIPAALKNTSWTNALTNTIEDLDTAMQLGNYQYLLLKK